MERKKLIAVIIIVLIFTIPVPIAFFSLFIQDSGDSVHYLNYKELREKIDKNEVKAGDTVYLKDTLSGIWYNSTTGYTYMSFESYDEFRTEPWGYDAGYQQDITSDFESGDSVKIKIQMEQELNSQGIPTLTGHIEWIKHDE